jgi:hypothetical protein
MDTEKYLGRKSKEGLTMENTMGLKIKDSIAKVVGPKVQDAQSAEIFSTTMNKFPSQLPEQEEESAKPTYDLSYYKSLYLPEEKSFIGSYIVSDDSQSNTIEVINIIENEFESRMFVDGARPFNIEIHKIKLPKSQVEIIRDVEGYEPFKYIKLPYWLYKKNKDVLKIQKINGYKRFSPNKSNDRPEFIQKLQDKQIEDYFNMEEHEGRGRKNFESLKNKKTKEENTEATGSGSSGGFEAPLFSSADRFVNKPKKTETKEATGSGSSGSYETPAAWAKSGSKKNWRGAAKTQIPGGKFVEVKKKCQKFPYCNQGDIKALNIFENDKLKQVIKDISKKHNISENVIKNILRYELDVFRKYKK